MVNASQLRPGTVLKIGNDIFKVFESTYHLGQGKMPGSVHARANHVLTGTLKEFRFRPEERLEETQLQKQDMEFLYADADSVTFMHPETYEQVSIPREAIGAATRFLRPEMKVAGGVLSRPAGQHCLSAYRGGEDFHHRAARPPAAGQHLQTGNARKWSGNHGAAVHQAR